jgi:hypothetical protein
MTKHEVVLMGWIYYDGRMPDGPMSWGRTRTDIKDFEGQIGEVRDST